MFLPLTKDTTDSKPDFCTEPFSWTQGLRLGYYPCRRRITSSPAHLLPFELERFQGEVGSLSVRVGDLWWQAETDTQQLNTVESVGPGEVLGALFSTWSFRDPDSFFLMTQLSPRSSLPSAAGWQKESSIEAHTGEAVMDEALKCYTPLLLQLHWQELGHGTKPELQGRL